MTFRRLVILVVYPDSAPMWNVTEARLRLRLGGHDVRVVYGLGNAAPHVAEAEVVLSFTFSNDYARRATSLRWIQGFGAGVESLISLPDLPRDILITNMRGIHGTTVAEHALAMIFAVSRDLMRAVRHQNERIWAPWPAMLLEGATLGILGVGAIAEVLARKCKALGMTTVGVSSARSKVPEFDRIYPRTQLIDAVRELDYLVLLAPLTPHTRSIISAQVIGAMKSTAFLVNVGRGGLVDEAALTAALEKRLVAGAALDTFDQEPLPPDHPFWSLTNVLMTPHNAGRHHRYVDDALAIFTANLQRYLAGDFTGMTNRIDRVPA
jgi:D-2-hydroxyacid dehydrogenase (NADP+)